MLQIYLVVRSTIDQFQGFPTNRKWQKRDRQLCIMTINRPNLEKLWGPLITMQQATCDGLN